MPAPQRIPVAVVWLVQTYSISRDLQLQYRRCQNWATVSTVASVTTQVSQPSTVFEMRTILKKKKEKTVEVDPWYTTHQLTLLEYRAYPLIVWF